MDSVHVHAAVSHHKCRHRRIDAAGQQHHAPAVGAEGQSAVPCDLFIVQIRKISAHVDIQEAVRLVHVHFQDLAALQDARADALADVRRLDGKRLVRPFRVDLKGFYAARFDLLHHERHGFAADRVQRAFRVEPFDGHVHGGTDGVHAEHPADPL